MSNTKETTVRWTWDEEVTIEEFIRRTERTLRSVSNTLWDLDGDMYLSDFRDLRTVSQRMSNLVGTWDDG